ncbi:MAG: sugar phosphate isomerase/epimerase [Chloroflexota bacterium]|nr:MAG: sugar phosphate isomerase/epimerase [Chloroflexota bacterium]
MKLGIVLAGVLGSRADFAELCRWAVANGYGAIDTPTNRSDGAAVARQHRLEVASGGGMPQLFIADPAERARNVASAIARIEVLADTGHELIQILHARPAGASDDETLEYARLGLTPVAKRAEERGVKLVIEHWHGRGNNFAVSPRNWRRLFEAVPSPALGLCFDPSHLVVLGIDYLRALREFGDRVYYAHAKDTELLSEGLYDGGIMAPDFGQRAIGGETGWWRYTLPGRGVVDWGRYIGTLREIGYDGVLAVEHEDDTYGWREDVPTTLEGLALAGRFLRQYV